jgi:hypothetical protein
MPGIFDSLALENPNDGMEEDDGIDEACDMINEEEHRDCPLCKYSQADASVIDRMNQMEQSMTGTASSEEIYRTLAGLYDVQVRQPLLNQGLDAPQITVEELRAHYTLHKLNLRDIISKEILSVNNMQIHFRKHQVATINSKTGRKKLDPKAMNEWVKLSKHKLELIKYYNGPLAKMQKKDAGSIKPYEFS